MSQTPWKRPSKKLAQQSGMYNTFKEGKASFGTTSVKDFSELGEWSRHRPQLHCSYRPGCFLLPAGVGIYLYFKIQVRAGHP